MSLFSFMEFRIVNSTLNDIDSIFNLYDAAIAFQKLKFNKYWPRFDRHKVEAEISKKRNFKIIAGDTIAGVFSVTYNDVEIWGEQDADGAIYLHRIVTGPDFRGHNLVNHIVEWAKQYALSNNINYIRLDCFADNENLVAYYKKQGFTFLRDVLVRETEATPKHYIGNPLALLQIDVSA
jgi:RimJ/RimL family protein N-acetyltransferase